MRSVNCFDGKPHDWGSWQPVAMVDLDSLVPPGEPPPNRLITLATHSCHRCPSQETLSVQGAHLQFIFVGTQPVTEGRQP